MFHLEVEVSFPCLLLAQQIVPVNCLVVGFPKCEKVSPENSDGAQYPGRVRVGEGTNVLSPNEVVLFELPFGGHMTIE
jgi:hypothetical protein